MEEVVKQDAFEAANIISGAYQAPHEMDYGTYSKIILFSNENLEGTAAKLSYGNKSVLTIAGSGDQYLAAKYYGAKNVDIFDINRFSYYLTCLKIVAIQHLGYYKFLNFFVPPYMFEPKEHFFEVSILESLIPFMSPDVAYFWRQVIISNGNKKNIDIGRIANINNLGCDEVGIKNGSPFYESKENYMELQRILANAEKPTFIETDVLRIKSVLKNSYDIAYLSNIVFRLAISNKKTSELDFFKKILEQLKGHLNDNAKIMANYYGNCRKEQVGFDMDLIEKISFLSKYLPYDDDFFDVDSDVAMIYTFKK